MSFLKSLFSSKKHDSPDVLGVYPEFMQVKALPERRYMKTARVLAVFILFNLACIIGIAGYFVYCADRVDVTIGNLRQPYLYTIDSSRKVIVPMEYSKVTMSALKLYVEKILQEYIRNRHEIIWNNEVMSWRWGSEGPIRFFSHEDNVYKPFAEEAITQFEASRSKGYVRDVHLYELKNIYGDTWEGVIDTFDMPIPDPFKPLCGACTDNSKACIDCKAKNTFQRNRYRIIVRVSKKTATPKNPLGVFVQAYNLLYMPIDEKEHYWDTPNDLKPEL